MFRTEPMLDEKDWQLRLEVGDAGVATLVLDRPERLNAWSWEASRQLARLVERIRFDDRIRVLVVRGAGRAFCAGVDLGLPEDRITGRSAAERSRNFAEGLRWVHEQFRVVDGGNWLRRDFVMPPVMPGPRPAGAASRGGGSE